MAGTVSVAKLASRRAKPDGVLVVPPREVTRFLHPLDVGELYGVGEKTREQLHRLGLRTVGDVAHTPLATLQRGIGVAAGHPAAPARLGHRPAHASRPRRATHEPDKSMGADETFGRDTDDRAVVLRELLRLSAKVTRRMRTAGVAGRTVTLRVRFADFTTITRSRTLGDATDVTGEVHATAAALFDALGLQRARIRLVGVRVEGLVPREQVQRQLVLGARERGWEEADRASRRGGAALRRRRRTPGHPAHRRPSLSTRHPRRRQRYRSRFPDPVYRLDQSLPRLIRDQSSREDAVPLSEEELRLLEQMEQALAQEDPKFVSTLARKLAGAGGADAHDRRRASSSSLGIAMLMGGAIAPADLARRPRLRGDARLGDLRSGRLARSPRPARSRSRSAARTSSSTSTTTRTAST